MACIEIEAYRVDGHLMGQGPRSDLYIETILLPAEEDPDTGVVIARRPRHDGIRYILGSWTWQQRVV